MEKPKFGDIIENHHAGENNPLRKGVFVRTCQRQRSLCWQLTDMKGRFWEQFVDKGSEYVIIGTIYDEKLDNIKRQAEEIKKLMENENEENGGDYYIGGYIHAQTAINHLEELIKSIDKGKGEL